jgi:hypothetical protein
LKSPEPCQGVSKKPKFGIEGEGGEMEQPQGRSAIRERSVVRVDFRTVALLQSERRAPLEKH